MFVCRKSDHLSKCLLFHSSIYKMILYKVLYLIMTTPVSSKKLKYITKEAKLKGNKRNTYRSSISSRLS